MNESTTDWFHAIGQVVVAAANVEAALGTLVFTLDSGQTDRMYAWNVTPLVERGSRRLKDYPEDCELVSRARSVFVAVQEVTARRNDVVHGWWRMSTDGKSAIRGRAWKARPELTVEHVPFDDLSALLADLQTVHVSVLQLAADIAEEFGSIFGS